MAPFLDMELDVRIVSNISPKNVPLRYCTVADLS